MKYEKPPFLLSPPGEENLPGPWFTLLAVTLLLAIWGFVGRMDYLEAAQQECAAKHMEYDPEHDVRFVRKYRASAKTQPTPKGK